MQIVLLTKDNLTMLFAQIFLIVILLTAACADEDSGYDYSHEEDSKEHEKPYHFGYEIEDANGKQHRHEHKDPDGTIRGSYGFVDDHGVHREVHYVADDFGFRAQVITNEKGTESSHPADVHLHSLYSPHKDVYVDEKDGHHY